MDGQTVECPMCAEQIVVQATACQFCGARSQVTATARSAQPTIIRGDFI
jgi:endogenous inhibitor of DNA gyrase (YacG/DUF329 family)